MVRSPSLPRRVALGAAAVAALAAGPAEAQRTTEAAIEGFVRAATAWRLVQPPESFSAQS